MARMVAAAEALDTLSRQPFCYTDPYHRNGHSLRQGHVMSSTRNRRAEALRSAVVAGAQAPVAVDIVFCAIEPFAVPTTGFLIDAVGTSPAAPGDPDATQTVSEGR
jgi:hypothetical protein